MLLIKAYSLCPQNENAFQIYKNYECITKSRTNKNNV